MPSNPPHLMITNVKKKKSDMFGENLSLFCQVAFSRPHWKPKKITMLEIFSGFQLVRLCSLLHEGIV